jgi:hypothetical protein
MFLVRNGNGLKAGSYTDTCRDWSNRTACVGVVFPQRHFQCRSYRLLTFTSNRRHIRRIFNGLRLICGRQAAHSLLFHGVLVELKVKVQRGLRNFIMWWL